MDYVAGLVDVFAAAPLTGNPLAVVENADDLSVDQMKLIAREFNQAETTFIMQSSKADRKLRSFTAAGAEVAGAGHNALGAWLWMADSGDLGELDAPITFHQEIGDEVLPITLSRRGGRYFGEMRQSRLKLAEPYDDLGRLASALGLDTAELETFPPPRAAATGVSHLLVRSRNSGAVDRAAPVSGALLAVLRAAGAEGCYVYAHDPRTPETAYARFFNPTVGLWEDAATGTAAGPLAAYLGSMGLLRGDKLAIEQGTKMGRRSILNVRLLPEPELSGSGLVVMRGKIQLG
jgi:PhzF family phenazine biosynthesis protein